jgi:hypothetical protein
VERGRRADRASRSVRRWQHDPDDAAGDEPVELRITEAIEPELFVDEADGGDFVVRTTHRVEAVGDGRSRVTYRMEITGPAAETMGAEIGPEISGDFPQVLAALAAHAEGRA